VATVKGTFWGEFAERRRYVASPLFLCFHLTQTFYVVYFSSERSNETSISLYYRVIINQLFAVVLDLWGLHAVDKLLEIIERVSD